MKHYKILKSCFLGDAKEPVSLNDRQAANLLAGGFVELADVKAVTKDKKG